MHHHDCPCPPAHHSHTDDYISPHHSHTDDYISPHHCHTDDVEPPMFFGPTTMFSWPTAAATTTSRSYGDNAKHDVRVDVPPPPSMTYDKCEDTPGGQCALGILGLLFWGAIIALIIYADKK